MNPTVDETDEIKSWLKLILKSENIEDLTVKIVGNSQKGDGYMGDVVFVDVDAVTKQGTKKDYHLVLKCAKRSKALRETSPVKEAFLNEIYVYNTVFPRFMQFQHERGVEEPFDKVPKCYGTFTTENMEVIALENLKMKGYILWDRKTPLTRAHVDMVIKEYAKFHAISLAMQSQEPETFQHLAQKLDDVFTRFLDTTEIISAWEDMVDEIYDLLRDDLSETVLSKWKHFKHVVRPFSTKVAQGLDDGLQVIIHGDCWNNNFMYHQTNGVPSKVAIIDWQLSKKSSPILDLSYFLFTTVSKEDIEELDVILKNYHNSLLDHLKNLGSTEDNFYPFDQFSNDWKEYCKYGVILAGVIHKISLSEEDEVPDMAKAAEDGQDMSKGFLKPIRDTASYRKRMCYIVKYVAEHDLI